MKQYSNFNASTFREVKDGKIAKVLGIISLISTMFVSILILPVTLIGLIKSISAREEGKIGLYLCIASFIIMLLQAIVFVRYVSIVQVELEKATTEYEGEYRCQDLILSLNKDESFSIDYNNSDSIKGTYTISKVEYDKLYKGYKYKVNLIETYRNIYNLENTNPYNIDLYLIVDDYGKTTIINNLSKETYKCVKEQ